jgi:uncharacterized membrane protein
MVRGDIEMSKKKQTKYSAKKAAVLQQNKSKISPVAIVLVAAVVVAVGAVAFYMTSTPAPATTGTVATASSGTSEVSYPVSMFDDGKARHFEYRAGAMTIRYFILKSSDGIIRAAFDACDVCWPAGKGYYQDGDDMVCRNCGRRFPSVKVNEVKGGCNPAPLNRRVEGGQLVLKAADILQGQTYFNFEAKA